MVPARHEYLTAQQIQNRYCALSLKSEYLVVTLTKRSSYNISRYSLCFNNCRLCVPNSLLYTYFIKYIIILCAGSSHAGDDHNTAGHRATGATSFIIGTWVGGFTQWFIQQHHYTLYLHNHHHSYQPSIYLHIIITLPTTATQAVSDFEKEFFEFRLIVKQVKMFKKKPTLTVRCIARLIIYLCILRSCVLVLTI